MVFHEKNVAKQNSNVREKTFKAHCYTFSALLERYVKADKTYIAVKTFMENSVDEGMSVLCAGHSP